MTPAGLLVVVVVSTAAARDDEEAMAIRSSAAAGDPELLAEGVMAMVVCFSNSSVVCVRWSFPWREVMKCRVLRFE